MKTLIALSLLSALVACGKTESASNKDAAEKGEIRGANQKSCFG